MAAQFDKRGFLKSMNIHGKAYRHQVMEIISICRIFSLTRGTEEITKQDDELSVVLRACDDALACTAAEGKKRSSVSDQRIKMVTRKLHEYERAFHHSTNSVEKRMEKAMDEDKKESGGVGWFRFLPSTTHRTRPEASSSLRVIQFHLLRSITDTQPILVTQVLTSRPNESEILWNFCRYPASSGRRITLVENPHFYHYQSPDAYQDEFSTGPMEDYQYADDIYVLTNMPSRIFLEFGEDSRVFDNVWQTNDVFIFKSICGKLEGERIVGNLFRNRHCQWCHEEPRRPQQQAQSTVHPPSPRSTTARSSTTVTPAWIPVEDWTVPISHVLYSQDIKQDTKIRIRIVTELYP